MPSIGHEFSDETLIALLRALRARSSSYPHSPALVAALPEVREDRMAAACSELRDRGHGVFRVSIPGDGSRSTRVGWSIAAG
jgi:hypothetical protein